VSEPYVALQVVMMPRDANPLPTVLPGATQNFLYMTIFGGVILSYIDQAGAIGARREVIRAGGPPPFLVTVAMNRVEFHQPVLVGDVVRFLTRLVRFGRTSITVHVNVEAERGQQVLQVTEAEVVYVGIDPTSPERRPQPLLGGTG
jgi:acyl-CoA thioesterase YciA